MTRGAGTAGRTDKKPSRKAGTPSRAPKTAPRTASSIPSIDDPQEQISSLRRERDEALARGGGNNRCVGSHLKLPRRA